MKLKVNEDTENYYGQVPYGFITGKDANPQAITEELFNRLGGSGYKLAILFDVSKDEYEEPAKETEIYFLDDLFDEFVHYMGLEEIERRIQSYKL